MIEFGREICGLVNAANQREWLVTNGIGGFASGTISGILTRRYHGLLIAALKPPLGRTLVVTKLDETVEYDGQSYPLYADRLSSGAIHPQGFLYIERFYLDGSIPVWIYAIGDSLLEKRIWMRPGENTTYIYYKYLRSGITSIHLDLRLLVNARDYHGATQATQASTLAVETCLNGLLVQAPRIPVTCYIQSNAAKVLKLSSWQRNYYLEAEANRGESAIEDHFTAGVFSAELLPNQCLTVVASTEKNANLNGAAAMDERKAYETSLLSSAFTLLSPGIPHRASIDQLILAADQFIVNRSTPGNRNGKTVIAGYPWFSDWGRDTMISLPGLSLATGRPQVARDILGTFAAYIDQGLLPNRFPDEGENPEYNTVDATLWFFEAIRAYLAETNDLGLLIALYPKLQEIIHWHLEGTRYHIQCDNSDGLLYAGEPGVQLSWMDAKVKDWVVTPRIGKPVEINALWFNALCSMADFAGQLDKPTQNYLEAIRKTRKGFSRFWNKEKGYLFDVLDGPQGNDPALRPNQLIAVSIHHSPLTTNAQRIILNHCARYLLTSFGLRSLAQTESGYIGSYRGDRWQRDAAYHQGTVWSWLMGPFISAHLRVYHDPETAWSFLLPIFDHLADQGLGSISEIFDGDAPHLPRGCIAQAWSVAEILRVVKEIQIIGSESEQSLTPGRQIT
jgi:predicted glycogen debranching enzyme